MEFGLDFMLESIQPKDVIIFVNPGLGTIEPHLYICIGRLNGDFQFLVATTKSATVYKQVAITRQNPMTAVNVKVQEECPLTKESWFNCNNIKNYTKNELRMLINGKFSRTRHRMPQPVYEELINGVCMSEVVDTEFIEYLMAV